MKTIAGRGSLSRRVVSSLAALLAPRELPVALSLSVLAVVVATALRWALGRYEPGLLPFGLYYPAVIYAAVVGGLLTGILAVLASTGIALWLFVGNALVSPGALSINVALFVVSSALLVAVGAVLRDLRIERGEVESVFNAVRDAALDGIIMFDAIRDEHGKVVDFRRIYMNAAAERMVGPARLLVGQRYLESSPTVNRDDLFQHYVEVIQTGIPAEDEFRLEAGKRWIYNLATRVGPDRLAVAFRDVTTTRATIERQKFLMRELNHRVKNVLTSVLSLARQTSLDTTAREYREALTARVTAMARAHDLLMTESWEGARLADIVNQTLAPYDRVSAQGPAVSIAPDLALGINMALHELATNAVKYGALSVPEGQVEIRWWLKDGEPGAVEMRWREFDGPPVSQPRQQGFGSRLLTRGFVTEGRHAELHFHADGLECLFRFDTSLLDPDEPLPGSDIHL